MAFASAINGLQPGTTTPNLSTRSAFQQIIGVGNINDIGGIGPTFGAEAGTGSGQFLADVTLKATASDGLGSGFLGGSSAISGANIVGLGNINSTIFKDVLNAAGVAGGTIYASATGDGTSSATTTKSVLGSDGAAASVVDLNASGLFNSPLGVYGIGNISLNAGLTGTSSALANPSDPTSVLGKVTLPFGAGANNPVNTNATTGATATDGRGVATNPLDGTGVNSILNLNSVALRGLRTYFEDPISPFFAEFSGLVPGPTGALTSTPLPTPGYGTGIIPGGSVFTKGGGSITATASNGGRSTATNNGSGDVNAFAGIFGAGALLANPLAANNGDITGQSQNGTEANPVEVSATTEAGSASAITNLLSAGIGTAAIQAGPNPPAGAALATQTVQATGTIKGVATNFASTSAKTKVGDVVSYTGGLTGTGGNTFATGDPTSPTPQPFFAGNNLTIGQFNINTAGSNMIGVGEKNTSNSAETLLGNATASDIGITSGIFGGQTILTTGANPANDPTKNQVLGFADATNNVSARTGVGTALASSFQTVSGISGQSTQITSSVALNVGGSASLDSTVSATSFA